MRLKSFLLLIFSFLLISISNAQSFKAELSAGLTANQIDGDRLSGFDKAGFYAGGGVGINLQKNMQLRSELLFVQKGSRSTEKSVYYSIWRINYLEIPVYVRFQLGKRFNVLGGVGADILINSKRDGGGGFMNNSNTMKALVPFSSIGFGYRLSDKFSLNARWLYAVSSITKSGGFYSNSIALFLSLKLNKE